MSLSLVIGNKDYTSLAQNYSFSNVARGGFEQAQIEITAAADIRRGDEVLIFDGGEVAWHGQVNSPGTIAKKTKFRTGITALGHGTRLKDKKDRQIFVDCDLTKWGPPGTARAQALQGSYGPESPEVNTDAGSPALSTGPRGAWDAAHVGLTEAWYYGNGIQIESLYYAWTRNGSTVNSADANWTWDVFLSTDDIISGFYGTVNLRAAGPGTGTLTTGVVPCYYALVQMYYAAGVAAGAANTIYNIWWTKLAVYGKHNLTKRGTESATQAKGFYASDIASYCLNLVGGFNTIISPAVDYIIRHLVYYNYVPVEQMVADAANFVGWMWGTWEPVGIFDTVPTFRFEPPPPNPTIFVSKSECEDVSEPVASLDRSYNVAYVKYRNSAGTENTVRVAIDNPLLTAAGITERSIDLDAGVASVADAQTQGGYALRLAQASQRGGGSVTVSGEIHTAGTGSKPATLVRSGRDRIRIADLNDDTVFVTDTRAIDSFLVERVETTVTGGRASTRIEFDAGADLQEVLNARMQSQLTAAGLS